MLNIIPFPKTRKYKGDGQTNSADFDPADPPLVGPTCAQITADPKFHRKVQRVLAKGERPIVEMLAEIGVRYGLTTEIDRLLDRYGSLPDEALDVTEGRDF